MERLLTRLWRRWRVRQERLHEEGSEAKLRAEMVSDWLVRAGFLDGPEGGYYREMRVTLRFWRTYARGYRRMYGLCAVRPR